MPSKKHTHKYEKIEGVWSCALDDCTHFMPGNVRGGSVVGKKSRCWECSNEFVLSSGLVKIDKPICMSCADPEIIEDTELDRLLIGNKDTEH